MRPNRPFRKQATSQELRDELLRFIEVKFYPENHLSFVKDRSQLLKLVVLKFAAWLDEKSVTLSADRFLEILRDKILMEAVRHGNTGAIKYPPAWLGFVVDSHLRIHGEDYYEEAKAIRNLADAALNGIMGRSQGAPVAPDPIRELASAERLLRAKKQSVKKPVKAQLDLL